MSLDRLAAGARPYLLLLILTFAVALPGIAAIPPLDRDESRFAVASREMIETGDYVTVRFQDELRAKKPPLANWLQAGAAELTGARDAIWPYRLPSVLGILVAVLATFHFGASLVGRRGALLAAAILAVTPLVASEAHQAKTDALLLGCVALAQGALARFYLAARKGEARPGRGLALLFWLAQAAAILTKGPILPMVSVLTIAALLVADRKTPRPWGWLAGLRPLSGIALVIVLAAPWAILVTLATRGQFIAQAVGHDLLGKVAGGQEAHAAPPATYLLSATATLWPGIVFIVPGLVRAWRARGEPVVRFCLAWAIPAWIVFEATPTKLPHYILPCVPALALLAGLALAGAEPVWSRRWVLVYALIAALVGVAVAGAAIAAPLAVGSGLAWVSFPCAVAALAAGIMPASALLKGRPPRAATIAVLAAAVTLAFLFGGVMPALDKLWVSPRVAALAPVGAPAVITSDREPSLIFLLGTRTRLADAAGAARFLLDTPGGVAVVDTADKDKFLSPLRAAGKEPAALGAVAGLNYSRGKPVDVTVWTLGPDAR